MDSAFTKIQLAGVARQIRPNDWVVFTAPGLEPALVQVNQVTDVLGDASKNGSPTERTAGPTPIPIPVLHTQLTLQTASLGDEQRSCSCRSLLYDWVEVGTLIDQPPAPWDGTTPLQAVQPAQFAPGGPTPILMQDVNGVGEQASGTVDSNYDLDISWPLTVEVPLSPNRNHPSRFTTTCCRSRAARPSPCFGTGDATVPGQSFMLAIFAVTYLITGSRTRARSRSPSMACRGPKWLASMVSLPTRRFSSPAKIEPEHMGRLRRWSERIPR